MPRLPQVVSRKSTVRRADPSMGLVVDETTAVTVSPKRTGGRLGARFVMKKNHVTHRSDSVTVLQGVLRAADLAARSYGPRAGAVISSRGGKVIWSRDGIGLLRGLRGGGAGERVGLALCRDLSADMHHTHGDGVKTSLIILGSLLRCGLRRGQSLAEARDYLSGVLSSLPLTAEPAEESTLKESTLRACDGNRELMEAVYGAADRAGDLGAVRVAPGPVLGARFFSKPGVTLPRGWCHSATGRGSWKRELEGPLVLCFTAPLMDWEDLARYIEEASAFARPILVLAPALGARVVKGLILNDNSKDVPLSVVGVPLSYLMGGDAAEFLTDVAALSGGRLIVPYPGMPVDPTDFGSVHRAELTARETILLGYDNPPNPDALDLRVTALAGRTSERDRVRGAALGGDLVTLEVRAHTDSETRRMVTMAEGALASLRSAARSGILREGGARALFDAAGEDGPSWVREALRAPLQALGGEARPYAPVGVASVCAAASKAFSAAEQLLGSSLLLSR